MKRLRLWFEGSQHPELVRSEFSHPCLERVMRAVRGKTTGTFSAKYGTFQWTPAVKAFCVLAVQSAAFSRESEASSSDAALLSGNHSSPAASLAFALGKPPQWLLDLFGKDLKGRAIAKRVFLCSNPELKRGGQVSLALNESFLSPQQISVFYQGRELTNRRELECLANALQAQAIGSLRARKNTDTHAPINAAIEQQAVHNLPAPFDQMPNLSWLKNLFMQETRRMLFACDVFSEQGVKNVAKHISQDLLFNKLAGIAAKFPDNFEQELSASERLGGGFHLETAARDFFKEEALRVALPIGLAGASSIFNYLSRVRGLKFELDFRYQYAIEIMRKIVDGKYETPPDICVLGLAPAARLLALGDKSEYAPLMVFPGMTHRVLSPGRQSKGLENSEYLFLDDDPSTSGMYFHSLRAQGQIRSEQVKVSHAEPDQIYEALKSQDPSLRAILFFPFYNINERFNNCVLADNPEHDINMKECVLFVHQRLFTQKTKLKLLNVLLRDAWLTLRERRVELERSVQDLLQNPEYLSFLCRSSGVVESQLL